MGDRKRWVLVALVLAAPLAAVAAGSVLQPVLDGRFQNHLQQELSRQGTVVDRQQLAAVHLDDLCESGKVGGFACLQADALPALVWVGIVTAIFGVGLLLAIHWAGRWCEGNRDRLVQVFRPGLRVAMASVAGLALLHAGLIVVTLYFLESLTIGRVHLFLIGAIALAAIGAAWSVSRFAFGGVRDASPQVVGSPVGIGTNARLSGMVDDIARRLDTAPPDNIVLGLDTTFFVTQARVRCVEGELTGRTLYVSLPLCRILELDELRSIVGHELGHFKGADTAYSERFAPIYRGAQEGLAALAARMTGIGQMIALAPALNLLGYFIESFAVAESGIGREREFAADRVAVASAGAPAFASALVKVHAYAPRWQYMDDWMREAIERRAPIGNLSRYFVEHAVKDPLRLAGDAFAGIADQTAAHPIDSHPPLRVRLEAIGVSLRDALAQARNASPLNPASNVLDAPDEEEERLSAFVQEWMRSALAGANLRFETVGD